MNNLKLEITSKAYNDMEIISDFIAIDNKPAANKMMKLFYKTFMMFLKHPNIGKSRPNYSVLSVFEIVNLTI